MEINTLSLILPAGGLAAIFWRQSRLAKAAISEKKRTKQLLEESELRFRILTRATNEAVWDWDVGTDSVWWNRNVQTLLGYNEEEIDPTTAWRMQNIHPEDRKRVEDSLQTRVRSEKEDFWFRRIPLSPRGRFVRGYLRPRLHPARSRWAGNPDDRLHAGHDQAQARNGTGPGA